MENKLEKMERKVNILEALLGTMVMMIMPSLLYSIWMGILGLKIFFTFLIITITLALYTSCVSRKFDEMKAASKVKDEEIEKAAELLAQICQGYDRCFAEECPLIGNASTCKAECDKKEEWYKLLKGER